MRPDDDPAADIGCLFAILCGAVLFALAVIQLNGGF